MASKNDPVEGAVRSQWFDDLQVGGQYAYREEGAESIVEIVDKSLDNGGWCSLHVRSIKAVHGGRFGILQEGLEWECGAALELTGRPNAYAGWSLTPLPPVE